MYTILIIDDDQDFLDIHRSILENNNYNVITAISGDEGLIKIQQDHPDLVILDVMLPEGYEGFEVARKIRQDLKKIKLPIIILSSVIEKKKIAYKFAPEENYLPVDVFVEKPVKSDQLINIIEELLGEKREEPESPL